MSCKTVIRSLKTKEKVIRRAKTIYQILGLKRVENGVGPVPSPDNIIIKKFITEDISVPDNRILLLRNPIELNEDVHISLGNNAEVLLI